MIAGDVWTSRDHGPGLWTNLRAPNADSDVVAEAHLLIELVGVTTDLDGWSLGSVVGLSNDAKVVAGNGRLNGADSAWVIHL